MESHGTRHLRQTSHRLLDVAGIEHHQIGQFVNDDDNVWQGALIGIFTEQVE